MKAETELRVHVAAYYRMVAEYVWQAHHVPLRARRPAITFLAGQGWMIDGNVYHQTADRIAARFDKEAQKWSKKIRLLQSPVPTIDEVSLHDPDTGEVITEAQ